MMNGEVFNWPMRVYIEDTDAGGIVYYVNYLKFIERARTESMRSRGYGKNFIAQYGLMFVVYETKAKYVSPARLDDEIVATAQITRIAKASMVFTQQVWCDDKLLFEAEVVVACVCKDTIKPKPIPEDLLAGLN